MQRPSTPPRPTSTRRSRSSTSTRSTPTPPTCCAARAASRSGWPRSRSAAARCIDRALDAGLRGILAFTLPEALWLAGHGADDIVVAYPTVDRAALRGWRTARRASASRVMVDCREHLDLIARRARRTPVRVCIDVDAGWWPLGGRVRIGAKRSPLRTPEQAAALAREIAARPRRWSSTG